MRTLACAILVALFVADIPANAQPLALEGVTVIPMDEERVLENQTVVISHGHIQGITAADDAEVPSDAEVVDASGKFLMPGLAEMHAHVPGGDDAQYREDVLFLYLANGVTLARGMAGDPVHLDTRAKLARGEILGPRLITAGPGFGGGDVESPEQGVQRVRQQDEAGYDFLKIFWGLTREEFDAIAQAAHDSGIRFAGHVPADVGVPRALEARYATIDHFDAYVPSLVNPDIAESQDHGFFGYLLAPRVEQGRIEDMARRTRDAGVWNVPTETIMYSALVVDLGAVRDERPEFQYMPKEVVDGWLEFVRNFRGSDDYDQDAGDAFLEVRLKLIRALHEAGAGLLLGSDAPQWFNVPGFSVHREMQVYVDAGLTPYEVLVTGTVNPARFFNEEEVFGKVEEGYKADLVLLDANPLEDIANAKKIAGVVRNGHWISREQIDNRLAEIAARQGN